MRSAGYVLILLAVGVLAFWFVGGPNGRSTHMSDGAGTAIVSIGVPETLSSNAQVGKSIFDANCSDCHGTNAVGQEGLAPPLVHIIYEPSHHGDESFQRAVMTGVLQHHWPFGNMPPVEGLTRGDVDLVIAYVRELQRANGIN